MFSLDQVERIITIFLLESGGRVFITVNSWKNAQKNGWCLFAIGYDMIILRSMVDEAVRRYGPEKVCLGTIVHLKKASKNNLNLGDGFGVYVKAGASLKDNLKEEIRDLHEDLLNLECGHPMLCNHPI